jgi:phospholipase C
MKPDPTKFLHHPMTRRRLLGYGAGVAATAFASSFLPPNLRRALAEPPATASFKDIKHVVLLMQENRSFDHYFGTLAGVRGFNDPTAMTLGTGKSVFYQPDEVSPDGYLLPFHLDTSVSNAQQLPSTNHGWKAQHESWNGGKMDNWLPAHRKADKQNGPYVMGHFNRADIPFHFALAEAFTICDAYHCSVLGPTYPNRLYWMTGTNHSPGTTDDIMTHNSPPKGGTTWKTYPERLEEAGVSWKVYHRHQLQMVPDLQTMDTMNFGFNVLAFFKQYQMAPPDSGLYTKCMMPSPEDQFKQDCLNDNLPAVSWIYPYEDKSEHPDHMPAAGAAFVASIVDAIAANPKVWAKTAFILNYDENDGLFDHVAPPTSPVGTTDEYYKGLPIGAGFRVPCIIVSPWTAGGWVSSEPFDHTSVLRFLEKFTGVRETNITDWRRQNFGDLTSAFRFQETLATPPKLPDTAEQLAKAYEDVKTLPPPVVPTQGQMAPTQESGSRKRISSTTSPS